MLYKWLQSIFGRFPSIRGRLILSFVGLAVVHFLLIGVYAIQTSTRELETLAVGHVSDYVTVVKEKTENFLSEIRGDMLFLRDSVPLRYFVQAVEQKDAPEEARWRPLAEEAFLIYSEHKNIYYQICFLDERGTCLIEVNSENGQPVVVPAAALGQRSMGRDAYSFLKAGGLRSGEVTFIPGEIEEISSDQTLPVIRCLTPVFNSDGIKKGVLVINIFAQDFFKTLVESQMSPGGRTVLVNQGGQYLHHPDRSYSNPEEFNSRPKNTIYSEYPVPVVSAILSGRSGTFTRGEDEIIAYTPLLHNPLDPRRYYVVFHSIPREVIFASIDSFRFILGALFLASAGLALLVGYRVTHYFTRPIIQLTRGTEIIAGGDFDHRLPVQSSDELGQLTNQFNVMASSLKDQRTSLEQAYTELRDTQAQLGRSEQLASLGRLAAGIAHEINNPMASIATCVEGLQRRVKGVDLGELEDLSEYLEIIRKATYRCKETAGKLLSFSRQSAPIFEPLNINDVVNEVVTLVDHEAGLGGIRVKKRLDSSMPLINGDKAQLGQILLNLIINGLDAIEKTGEVTVMTTKGELDVRIEVTDTGCGIPEEDLKRIFEPFFTSKEVGKGTGLGLSICENIVARHNGSIAVQSVVGNGSTFIVTLPATKNDSHLSQADSHRAII